MSTGSASVEQRETFDSIHTKMSLSRALDLEPMIEACHRA